MKEPYDNILMMQVVEAHIVDSIQGLRHVDGNLPRFEKALNALFEAWKQLINMQLEEGLRYHVKTPDYRNNPPAKSAKQENW